MALGAEWRCRIHDLAQRYLRPEETLPSPFPPSGGHVGIGTIHLCLWTGSAIALWSKAVNRFKCEALKTHESTDR
jgi:hypothetical protein